MFKKENGITLVALIITIVILLILAGVSIATLQNTKLFNKSVNATNTYKRAEQNEVNTLNEYSDTLNTYFDELNK